MIYWRALKMKPDRVHRGITWQDFPMKGDTTGRKLAFAEFCRGTHALCGKSEGLEGAALKAKLQELGEYRRKRFGTFAKKSA
jgi:hypothetical protein